MAEMQAYDVAVVGLGAMGSAALYATARRGLRVIGFDRLEPARNRSSSFARELLVPVLATTCREFGEEHADSLTTMANLAAILWQGGERDEAYALQQQVFETQRRVHGDCDPATRAAAVPQTMEQDPASDQ